MNTQVRDAAAPLRALVAKRLSRLTDATTHLETETETIGEYVKRKKITVVAETEDLDVSGGKPIRERPGVGPWLSLEHLDEWDVLIIYKLDRGFRSHLDFVNFYHEFCEVHGKKIVSVSEDIDMSTQMGKFMAGILVQFAEWELTRMKERRAAAAKIIRREARYGGGSFGFGYEPYKEGAYWYLRPHPVYSAETEKMARAIVAGKSPGSVARDLNDRGIPTARDVQNIYCGRPVKGYQWLSTSVIDHLRSDLIRGHVLHYVNGSTEQPVRVLDSSGNPVRREPLISDDELWYKVQAALDVCTKKLSGVRAKGSVLLQIGFCGYCGAPLHQNTARRSDGSGNNVYYTCKDARTTCRPIRVAWKAKPKAVSVRRELLDSAVEKALLEAIGGYELLERRVISGDDHSQTLLQLGMQISDLTTQHFTRGEVPDFFTKMAALQAEHARIFALPRKPAKIRKVSTGKTFRQWWEEADDEERHGYLKAAGVTVRFVRAEDTDKILVFDRATDEADDTVLDIPLNIFREFGGSSDDLPNQSGPHPGRFVVNMSLGTLREQLQRASKAGE